MKIFATSVLRYCECFEIGYEKFSLDSQSNTDLHLSIGRVES